MTPQVYARQAENAMRKTGNRNAIQIIDNPIWTMLCSQRPEMVGTVLAIEVRDIKAPR